MLEQLQDKKVLFITTKNLDYIRNTQELNLLKSKARSVDVIGFTGSSYASRLFSVFCKLIFKNTKKYDVIWIGFAPQLVLPFFHNKFKRKPGNSKKPTIIIDFFVSMYDTFCCDRQKISKNSLLGKYFHHLDQITLRLADSVISDTKAHGEYFSEEFGIKQEKIYTLYLEADHSIYYPRNEKRLSELEGKFVVLYFGSVLPLQGVDVILDAMEFLDNCPKLQMIFIGPLSKATDKPHFSQITYYSWLSQEDLALMISQADLCLAGHFHGSIDKAKRTIPGKAYIYQAMEKPMILGDNSANHELFKESNSVFFVEMGSAKALAEEILRQYQKWCDYGKSFFSSEHLSFMK